MLSLLLGLGMSIGHASIAPQINRLAGDLMRATPSTGNRLLSPVAQYLNLSMILTGSSGQTEDKLRSFLGVVPGQSTTEFQNSLVACQQALRIEKGDSSATQIDNQIWFGSNSGLVPNSTYRETITKVFLGDVKALDFTKPSAAATEINHWVNEKSHGLLPEMIAPAEIAQLSALFLTTVYFEGQWKWAFNLNRGNPQNKLTQFTTADGQTSYIDKLIKVKKYKIFKGRNGEAAVQLPFSSQGEHKFSFYVLLPARGHHPSEFWQNDAISELITNTNRAKARQTFVALPQFSFDHEIILRPDSAATRALDLDFLFNTTADFRPMVASSPSAPLRVSFIKQKSRIEIDKNGVRAAAAASSGVISMGAGPSVEAEFVVDRPFAIVIAETDAPNTILFVGEVNSPGSN